MALAQANNELLPLAHSERLTATALVAPILSMPSQSMVAAVLGTATLLSSRMMTLPLFSRSPGNPGGAPLAVLPSPQICTPSRLPGLA